LKPEINFHFPEIDCAHRSYRSQIQCTLGEEGKTNDDIKENPLNLHHVSVINSVKSLDKAA